MRNAHVDESTLDALLNNTVAPAELGRLKQHLASCRPCARRVEEWRDLFGEVESIIPTMERPALSAPGTGIATPILVPSAPPRTRRIDYTKILLPAGAALAIGVAIFAIRGRRSAPNGMSAGLDSPVPEDTLRAPVLNAPPLKLQAPVPLAPTLRPSGPSVELPTRTMASPKSTVAAALPSSAAVAAAGPRPFTEAVPAPPQFQRIEMADAIRRLGGSMRLIEGLAPDHVEAGPGQVVPGAQPDAEIIRVVYLLDQGVRLLLDQQHRSSRPSPESGDTLIATAPNGVSLARWEDEEGFWLSLAGRLSGDSLKVFVVRVR